MKALNNFTTLLINATFILLVLITYNPIHAQNLEVQGQLKIADGTQSAGKVLMSDSSGLASWTSPGLNIGDTIHGGIIFYLDGSRQHGLIAKMTDEPGTYLWSDSTLTTEAWADGPHGGAFNQRKIFEVYPITTAPAAHACDLVQVNQMYDWYLPSRYELYLMYMTIGPGAPPPNTNIGNFALDEYWSSTEFQEAGEKCCAHFINFGGNPTRYNEDNNKDDTSYRVRAVHAF